MECVNGHNYASFKVIKRKYFKKGKNALKKNNLKNLHTSSNLMFKKFKDSIEKTDSGYTCKKCEKGFSTRIKALLHSNRESCSLQKKRKHKSNYVCPIKECQQVFEYLQDINRHKKEQCQIFI